MNGNYIVCTVDITALLWCDSRALIVYFFCWVTQKLVSISDKGIFMFH